MNMQLNDNKILITGATSGIGLSLVQKFIELGTEVIGIGRNVEKLKLLEQRHNKFIGFKCDIADKYDLDNLIVFIKQYHTDINILINNAGIQNNYFFADEKDGYAKILTELTVNLISPLHLIYGLLPILLNKPNAAIVNVSSGLAFAPKKTAPVYCGTKAAIHSITKALRYQLENTTVKVFEIIPPLVETPMTEGRGKGKITPEQLVDEFMRNFGNDKFESNIGKTKILRFIQRISPSFADRILKNG
jgi:short-subunit dehydrogenase involved in D-alanine esterification of teichoic acids